MEGRKLKVGLDRETPEVRWDELKKKHPRGRDIVVEATGGPSMLPKAIDCGAKGGTVVFYGAYDPKDKIEISSAKIFSDEITILG
jgi:D-arabinitol dehydrogenase (NADP+)